jgi:SAM-dependent methyltransferase
MKRPSDLPTPMSTDELLIRYRENYGLSSEMVEPTTEQVQFHFELERSLTAELLASTPENRWDTFQRCYNSLYTSLPWLSSTGAGSEIGVWARILGSPPQRIYEVGSGAGRLAAELASGGFEVTATDISHERGGNRVAREGLTWGVTDGVNLDRFADVRSFDAVISDQVIEHLHPDDVLRHFEGAKAILREGGRYIFRTPHAYTGPHDVSRVFGLDNPVGMHLREYTNRELNAKLRRAGFASMRGAIVVPQKINRRGQLPAAVVSNALMAYLVTVEAVLGTTYLAKHRRALVRYLRGPLKPRLFTVAS